MLKPLGERRGKKNRPAGKSVGPQWHRDGKWNGEEGREQVAEGSFTASSRRRNENAALGRPWSRERG